MTKEKKAEYGRELFSSVDWLPPAFLDQKEEKVSPEKMTREEALESMKSFSDSLLGEGDQGEVVLKDVLLKRTEKKTDCKLGSGLSLDLIWENYPERLVKIKELKNVKVFILGTSFLPKARADSWEFCFLQKESELLNNMVRAMKLKESEVWVSAVDGEKIDFDKQRTFEAFHREILRLNPQVIISFGAISTHALMKEKKRLSLLQGEFFSYTIANEQGKEFEFSYMPLFHPEYLLLNPNMKRKTWEGMQKIMERLKNIF